MIEANLIAVYDLGQVDPVVSNWWAFEHLLCMSSVSCDKRVSGHGDSELYSYQVHIVCVGWLTYTFLPPHVLWSMMVTSVWEGVTGQGSWEAGKKF